MAEASPLKLKLKNLQPFDDPNDNAEGQFSNSNVKGRGDTSPHSPSKRFGLESEVQRNEDIVGSEKWAVILAMKGEVDKEFQDIDKTMNRVLAKHEYEYLHAYNFYVKNKEKDLMKYVQEMQAQNQDTMVKDQKITKLEFAIIKARQNSEAQQALLKKKEEEISTWKQNWEDEKTEKEFYHKSAQESKRKHKIVKLALSRLQLEYDKMKAQYLTATEDLKFSNNLQKKCEEVLRPTEEDSTTFVTKVDQDKLPFLKLNVETLPNIITASASSTNRNNNKSLVNNSSRNFRVDSLSKTAQVSRYQQGAIPTRNLKIQQFMDIIFGSLMNQNEIKEEIKTYMQVLETNYTEKIQSLQVNLERVKKQVTGERTKNVSKVTERSDLEQLFVNCVEDVRRDIIKRRLKAEIIARQRPNDKQVKEFESTLVKLADLAQNRVKLEEFTAMDRIHILDLFVNNEKTLLRVHEVLFPGTSSFIKTQQLKNASDMISIGVESGVHFNTRSDTQLNESITDLMAVMSSKKTKRHHLMGNISDDLMNTAATTIQQMSNQKYPTVPLRNLSPAAQSDAGLNNKKGYFSLQPNQSKVD